MDSANQTTPAGAPESGIPPAAPVGSLHPLVRPSSVGWWWVLHCGRWRCGRVIEDWDEDSGGLIWSDGGAWYCVARINVDLMTGTHWFPATPPDWPNVLAVAAPHIQPKIMSDQITPETDSALVQQGRCEGSSTSDLLGVFVTARLKGGINGEPRQGWVETVNPLTIRGESGTLYECEGTPVVVINPPDRQVCRCEHPGPHSHPGSAGKFCAVCGWDISPNAKLSGGDRERQTNTSKS